MNRLLLLHGYTEEASIFDPLLPLLPAGLAVVPVHLEQALAAWQPAGPVNVATVAGRVAEFYHITAHDALLGHSMGGWLAMYIKQATGATALLLSSFTDQAAIVSARRNPRLLALYARLGLIQSGFMRERFKRNYRRDESRQLYATLVDAMPRFGRRYVARQLQVLFAPAPPLTVAPDLRLHAKRDNIIRAPQEPYVELPGDHFAHYFHPQLVVEAIRPFLT